MEAIQSSVARKLAACLRTRGAVMQLAGATHSSTCTADLSPLKAEVPCFGAELKMRPCYVLETALFHLPDLIAAEHVCETVAEISSVRITRNVDNGTTRL